MQIVKVNVINIFLVKESSLNMTRWGDEDIETRSLKFQQPLSLAVQFLGAPPPPAVGFEVYKFSESPSNFFRELLSSV